MENKVKIMSIGDIHGRDSWKEIIFGSVLDYEHWKLEAKEGIYEFMSDQYPVLKTLDKIVFIGDYVDSFNVSNIEMLKNLEDIIYFKKMYREKVVLLLGNHDIQYFIPDQICSGYRPEMKYDFEKIYRENIDLFQICFYHEGDRRTLWTHAGVTQGWLKGAKKHTIFNPKYRFYDDFKNLEFSKIDVFLNQLWKYRNSHLFSIDSDSGGMSQWAGPLWVRPGTLKYENVEGYDQIVGHTPKKSITTFEVPDSSVESNPKMRDKITIIDCLEHGDGTVLIEEY